MKRVERLVHRGRIDVAALAVDPRLVGERAARERVLAVWTLHSRLLDVRGTYFVTLVPPRSMRTQHAPGLPFVRTEQGLVASPELNPPPPDVAAYFSSGRVAETDLDVATPIEIHDWFDLTDFESIEPESLGEAPAPPGYVAPREAETREVLDVPEAVEERDAVLAALTSEAGASKRLPWWARWWRALRSAGKAFREEPRTPTAESPSAWRRLIARIENALAALTFASGLHRLFGRRQADYLRRLLRMLDDQDDEALRHAIPLSKSLGDALSRPSFGLPKPRNDLRISSGGLGGGGRSMVVGFDVFELLRERYRRLVERLVRQDRIDEAAFVLAELLQEDEEAVQLLENHERFVKAAELAEARSLAPDLIVRQWFLAKRYDRAVRIAKRYDAFEGAVLRLQRSDRSAADALRLLWADALADAGDFVGAVDTAWPVEEGRHIAHRWIAAAVAVGGPPGARMIVRALELIPEDYERLRARALALLDDDGPDTAPARDTFRATLSRAQATAPLRVLARPALRSLYRDEALGAHADATIYRALGRLSGDSVLEADRPRREKRAVASGPVDLYVDASDATTWAIEDVVLLPDGRFLVGLGENGALLLTRDGRVAKHFDEPTHHIVPSDGGHRAIVAARRGDVWRLARFDVVRQRSKHWCEAELSTAASSFDGWTWYVNSGQGLDAIDATARRFTSTSRSPDCAARAIVRTGKVLAAVAPIQSGSAEVWRYQLPQLTLRSRVEYPDVPHGAVGRDAFLPTGEVVTLAREEAGGEGETTLTREFRLDTFHGTKTSSRYIDLAPSTIGARVAVAPGWCAVVARTPLGCQVLVYADGQDERVASVSLQESTNACIRVQGNLLIVGDDRGRLITIDVAKRRLLRSLRVRA
ncbi:MAG: bpX6 domain-containing protein [Deltaproteobacteria bacterium]